MFDILVYLFETYVHAGACPESDQLARKLSAAGFEEEEISEALSWLDGLRAEISIPDIGSDSTSVRIYADEEMRRLDAECRGFLTFLENAGVLDALTREMIIERAMALSDHRLTRSRLKVIVLMVLWQQEQSIDTLILDELLTEEDEDLDLTYQ
ncbi:MAG: DUF494 domain-containing protein [Rhodocyclaceae bacterium]|nr:DUF494 domain-containing protein [Rhodocyclaceae bacterium]MCP5232793.1 DUF494 domain-containing protein [Zoogloeaceae bacterium]MCB1912226.1 DUF494 domain-containing protein [Rhodocyclaceae bacterium]MCP5240785.1 DUF494 domain-containing protein [Zoogloeaceae bacterium]MCP5253104.1 DUF494 domain-containing protein [Zoogloeaceae bacterium]